MLGVLIAGIDLKKKERYGDGIDFEETKKSLSPHWK